MAIINNANPGSQINLLCLIFRVLHRNNGKYTEDELMDLCRPTNLPIGETQEKRFRENLRFWEKESHQLWQKNADQKFELVYEIEGLGFEEAAHATNVALFAPNIENLFGKDRHDTEGLFRSISCILASKRFGPFSGDTLVNSTIEKLFSEYLPKYIPNDSEKRVVLQYGAFLGYFTKRREGSGYVVDPTRVVCKYLPQIFLDSKDLEAANFFSKLAETIPVLDGGFYRSQVEENMDVQGEIGGRRVSESLSLAIERLRLARRVTLEDRSDDAEAFILQLPNGHKRVSTIAPPKSGFSP